MSETKNIRESFDGLLTSLVDGEIITQEVKDKFVSELDKKIEESVADDTKTREELEKALQDTIKEAADKIKAEYADKFAALEELDKPEEVEEDKPEDKNTEEVTISDAFENFVASLPETNVKAFNEFTASLSDEQKELGKKFLEGTWEEKEVEVEQEEVEQNPENQEQNNGEQQPEENPVEVPAEPSEEEESFNEACCVIRCLSEALCEAGLEEISNSILSEAKISNIAQLTKKQEREYEKFLKNSVKQLARQNKEMRLAGGVVGGTRRIRNLDDVLVKLRKKLYLSENSNSELNKKLFEALEKIASIESENRSFQNRIGCVEKEKESAINESNKLKDENKLLTEAVETAKKEASINEAKAYLAESASEFSPSLRRHLEARFKDCSIDEVKKNLNEAVEAYRNERRDERLSLRKNSTSQISRTVNEAVENKVDESEDDALALGFARMSESIVWNNKNK